MKKLLAILAAVVALSATTILAIDIALTMAALPATAGSRSLPVVITANEYDVCSNGKVGGLNPRGDGFLAVKAGPGLEFDRIDKLGNGTEVYTCGQYGDWLAIVYSRTGKWTGCGVMTSWPKSRPYTGPCLSGWVHRNWIEHIAG